MDPVEAVRDGMISLGATCAWSRRIFEAFGPLCGDMPEGDPLVEDLVITFRSAALGRILRIDEELLGWRAGGLSWNESSRPGHAALFGTALRYQRWREASYRAVLRDLERRPVENAEVLRAICDERIAELRHTLALADATPLRRLGLAPRAAARSIARRDPFFVKQALKYLFAPVYAAYADARYGRRTAGTACAETEA